MAAKLSPGRALSLVLFLVFFHSSSPQRHSNKEDKFRFTCPEPSGKYPFTDDCRSYILCWTWTNPTSGRSKVLHAIRHCPESMLFDVRLETCVYSKDAICYEEEPHFTCPQANGIFRNRQCDRYWRCFNETPILRYCPYGYKFDTVAKRCLPWLEAKCEEKGGPEGPDGPEDEQGDYPGEDEDYPNVGIPVHPEVGQNGTITPTTTAPSMTTQKIGFESSTTSRPVSGEPTTQGPSSTSTSQPSTSSFSSPAPSSNPTTPTSTEPSETPALDSSGPPSSTVSPTITSTTTVPSTSTSLSSSTLNTAQDSETTMIPADGPVDEADESPSSTTTQLLPDAPSTLDPIEQGTTEESSVPSETPIQLTTPDDDSWTESATILNPTIRPPGQSLVNSTTTKKPTLICKYVYV